MSHKIELRILSREVYVKQQFDTYTADMLPPGKRPRGRPSTGLAKSAAQRKSEQRERLLEQGLVQRTYSLSVEVAEALDRFVQFRDEDKSSVVDRILRDRLLRKR